MNDVVQKLLAERNYRLATIAIKNLFAKNPGDSEMYRQLVDVFQQLHQANIPEIEKLSYLQQLETATHIYSEQMELTDENFQILTEVFRYIRKAKFIDKKESKRAPLEPQEQNENVLLTMKTLFEELLSFEQEAAFFEKLTQLQQADRKIQKQSLTAEQLPIYESLAARLQKLVDERLEQFEQQKLRCYNLAAIEHFHNALQLFTVNEAQYKSDFTQIRQLAETKLCCFDEKYLMSTTVLYFNHVYHTVLNSLSSDMKYFLTEVSIKTKKRALHEVQGV